MRAIRGYWDNRIRRVEYPGGEFMIVLPSYFQDGYEEWSDVSRCGEFVVKNYWRRATEPASACQVLGSTWIWHISSRTRIYCGGGLSFASVQEVIARWIEAHPDRFGVFHADPMGKPDEDPVATFRDEEEACKYADLLNDEVEPYNAGTDDMPSWRSHSFFVDEIDD